MSKRPDYPEYPISKAIDAMERRTRRIAVAQALNDTGFWVIVAALMFGALVPITDTAMAFFLFGLFAGSVMIVAAYHIHRKAWHVRKGVPDGR